VVQRAREHTAADFAPLKEDLGSSRPRFGTRSLCPDVDDGEGLICGFRLSPLGAGGAELLDLPPDGGVPLWLHFNVSDSRAHRWLRAQSALPAAAREVLLDPAPRIHARKLERGFTAVLGDLNHDFDADPDGFGELRIYLDRERVITTRRHPLKSVDRLRRALTGSGQLGDGSTLVWFQNLIETLGETFAGVLETLAERVDEAEDRILAGSYQKPGRALGAMRRLLARLRRHLNANRVALSTVPERELGWGDAEHRRGLREAIARLDAVGQDLELIQERARLLEEEIGRRLSEATNRNLFVLSVVTTALLPITLLTGVFGMNVGGLPWLDSPSGFGHVLTMMVTLISVALVFLYRAHVFRR
jgi:zinc transporter